MAHPHAEILRMIADGKQVEVFNSGRWHAITASGALSSIADGVKPHWFRELVPRIHIGNFDVPEPMRVEPSRGTHYFTVNFSEKDGVEEVSWQGDVVDRNQFAHGMAHATREAAVQHAEALAQFTTQVDL